MGIEKLIPVAVLFAMMVAATGQLTRLVREVQTAQLKLLKLSQTSKWGRAMLLPERNTHYSERRGNR